MNDSGIAVLVVFAAVLAWLAFAFACRGLLNNPRGDIPGGLLWYWTRVYMRVMHPLRVIGREHVPDGNPHPGPLLVVANHASGLDPILVQSILRFEVRWMMADDMQIDALADFWSWLNIISVKRGESDRTSALHAIRHVQAGGVLGLFPEGGIERPAGVLMPFLKGINLITRRTGAPVLPIVITGVPETPTAWGAFFSRSHPTVHILPLMRFEREDDAAGMLEEAFGAIVGGVK